MPSLHLVVDNLYSACMYFFSVPAYRSEFSCKKKSLGAAQPGHPWTNGDVYVNVQFKFAQLCSGHQTYIVMTINREALRSRIAN